jgi:hypothetical protein
MKDLAHRLIAYEAAAAHSFDPDMAAAIRVIEGLRRPLIALAGSSGFRALLARALALARAQVPTLRALQARPDGSLEGLAELYRDEDVAAGVALIGELLGLLEALIGESLTIRIAANAWPALPAFDKGSRESEDDAPR